MIVCNLQIIFHKLSSLVSRGGHRPFLGSQNKCVAGADTHIILVHDASELVAQTWCNATSFFKQSKGTTFTDLKFDFGSAKCDIWRAYAVSSWSYLDLKVLCAYASISGKVLLRPFIALMDVTSLWRQSMGLCTNLNCSISNRTVWTEHQTHMLQLR